MGKRGKRGERLGNEDLLTQVLSRLRVKSLLRCKAVSKAWSSLISSPSFIQSHLRLKKDDDDDDDDILIGKINLSEEDFDEFKQVNGSFSLIHSRDHEYVAHLIYPYSKGDYNFSPNSSLVGCDCGIVCVSVDVSRLIRHQPNYVYLWNPATRRSKLIAPHTIHNNVDDLRERVAVGVGFDFVGFDFKVVRVVYLFLNSVIENASAEVYSAKKNTWQKIEGKLTDVPWRCVFDFCLHGFLFAKGYYGMTVFDLNKEVFVCDIKFPVNDSLTRIVDYKDSVAVVIYKERGPDQKINLWKLDNEACLRGGDGVVKEASWSLMLSVDVGKYFDFIQGLYNNSEFLLLIYNEVLNGEWFWYNSVKKVGNFSCIYPIFDFGNVFKYRESLLSIPGSKLLDWPRYDDEDGREENSFGSEIHLMREAAFGNQDDNEENRFVSDDDNEDSDAHYEVKVESSTSLGDDMGESSPGSGGE